MEDDPGVARLEQLRLERAGLHGGHGPRRPRRLEHIAAGEIELIILDQQFSSGTSGLEFFRQVKDAGHNVPAILVTGFKTRACWSRLCGPASATSCPRRRIFSTISSRSSTRVLDQVRTERELAESRIVDPRARGPPPELEHEIAQRKRVEQALREAEESWSLMVESVRDFAIFTVDPAGKIATWNSGAEQLFGYSEQQILGRPFAVVFTEEDQKGGIPEQEIAGAAAKGRSTGRALAHSAKTAAGSSPAACSA